MGESGHETVDLLRRWHGGDRAALDVLLPRHVAALREFVRAKLRGELRHLRGEADSMDIVQEAAARVLEYSPPFAPTNGRQFHRLLRQITIHQVLNRLRAPRNARRAAPDERSSEAQLERQPAMHSSLFPDRAAQKSEARAAARAWARVALELLPDERDRELVLLASGGEASWRDIGARIGLSEDAARMRFHRLLPKLANHIRVLSEGRLESLLSGAGE